MMILRQRFYANSARYGFDLLSLNAASNVVIAGICFINLLGLMGSVPQVFVTVCAIGMLVVWAIWLGLKTNATLVSRLVTLGPSGRRDAVIIFGGVVLCVLIWPMRIPLDQVVAATALLIIGVLPLAHVRHPDRALAAVVLTICVQALGLGVLVSVPVGPAILIGGAATVHLVVHQRLWPVVVGYALLLLGAGYGDIQAHVVASLIFVWLLVSHHSTRMRTYRFFARAAGGRPALQRVIATVFALQARWVRGTQTQGFQRPLHTLKSFDLMDQLERRRLNLHRRDVDGLQIIGDPTTCRAIVFWHTSDFLRQIVLLLHGTAGDNRPIILPRKQSDARFEAALRAVVGLCGRDIEFPHTAREHITARRRFAGQDPVWVIGAEFAFASDPMGASLRRLLMKCRTVLAQCPASRSRWQAVDMTRFGGAAYVATARENLGDLIVDLPDLVAA